MGFYIPVPYQGGHALKACRSTSENHFTAAIRWPAGCAFPPIPEPPLGEVRVRNVASKGDPITASPTTGVNLLKTKADQKRDVNAAKPEGENQMDMTTKHDVFKPEDPRSNIAHAIDKLRISESDRQLARECLCNGELMADLICRAGENLRSAATLVGRSLTRAR